MPTDLIKKFWAAQHDRGERSTPVWALVSLSGKYPMGYIKGWSVNKRSMERRREAEWNPENWKVEKICPQT